MGPADGHTPFAGGEEVDHYRVIRSLGRGGMGEVFLARDTELGRRVALKAIHPQLLGSDREVSRFLFEARATARFSHPHIVTIFGVGQHRDIPYMALEYLEGGTLRGRMRGGRMGEREAIRVALAIAEALEESHANGVTHGDLKPNNVVIPRDGRIQVLDFGLARIVSRPTVPRDDEDARAMFASLSSDGRLACMATRDSAVETWDTVEDHRIGRHELTSWDRLLATASGCLVLDGAGVTLLPDQGASITLATEARAIAADDQGVMVATDTAVLTFDHAGAPGPSIPIGPGIAAVARRGGGLVLGYADGNIECLDAGAERAHVHFEDTVSSPVIHLAAGPMGTVAAGYANGQVGLWSGDNGELLTTARLHGPVDHLAVSGSDLVAATGLGDHLWWDLGHLTVDRCDQLADVWHQVPVVWEGGLPAVRPAPPEHECLRAAGRGRKR